MAEHPEVIRKQMAETRANLTEKLEALENQVSDTVQSTTQAVASTVEAVKDTVENVTGTVQETVHSVAETLNIRRQFERHPWVMFGGAVTAGWLAAYLLGGKSHSNGTRSREGGGAVPQTSSRRASAFAEGGAWTAPQHGGPEVQPAAPPRTEPREEQQGWFWKELGHLKNLALGSLMGVVHDMAAQSFPGQLGEKIAQEVDHLTQKLGAEPIHGLLGEDKK